MPNLQARLAAGMSSFYEIARVIAANETGIEEDEFPATCPYTVAEILG